MQAADMLRPGGLTLHSTCTFSPEENEQTIEYLLENHPEFTICEMEGYEGFSQGIPEASQSKREDLKKTVRIFPHRMEGEGHFLALLKKGEATPEGESEYGNGTPQDSRTRSRKGRSVSPENRSGCRENWRSSLL